MIPRPTNMKKQFFRVKQLADQTFLRAEKSEVLNHEELQIADQKVECLRSAITAINKKIAPNGPVNDKEKRMKKCLEYQLGVTFTEEGREEKECLLFQHVLKESGRVEQDLAKEYAEHESKVEELVFGPLQKVLENEFPSVLKQKHNLKKYILDKDSASNRYHATKKENLKEDMEEADSKVEQSRDTLAIEMFNLLARENEFSSYILQLLKLQRGYHESALKNLETIIPQLERKIGDSHVKRVFGIPLAEHLRVTGKKLAYPLEVCITTLTEFGMSEEGLFRIAGSMSKVKRLKSALDSGCFSSLISEYRDVHVLASCMKLYLRELPEPLLTFDLHKDWMQSMQIVNENQKMEVVQCLLERLPQENYDNLAYLIQFLAKLSQYPENKMSSSNIAIVMSPNLLWNKSEEANINMGNCAATNLLVELFIKEVNTFFPEDTSKYVSITGFFEEEPIPKSNNGKIIEIVEPSGSSNESSILDSPRPNQRKKKPAAPVPPSVVSKTDQDLVMEKSMTGTNYPSGSTTLNRPPKATTNKKNTIGVNTNENELSLSRNKSLTKEDVKNITHNMNLVNADAQTVETTEKNFKTTATYVVESCNKPVAAPRTIFNETKSNNNSGRTDIMSKSTNSADLSDVQLRKTEFERVKPEIPARPASLAPLKRTSLDMDPSVQKTQCSVYSVANKQQPSIMNIQNRNEKFQLGHDTQFAEKEKFLGHKPSNVENKSGDINSNNDRLRTSSVGTKPAIPPKSQLVKSNEKLNVTKSNDKLFSKSNEKLNDMEEKVNGNQKASHARTRSEGNTIDLSGVGGHTPPSPRSLNKPTEPPPPPPVIPKKPEPESTDF